MSECGQEDFLEYVRRLIFSVAIGNGDMHLKNWSLIYPDSISPRLSPAYDFVPSVVYIPNDDPGLRLGGTKSFLEVTDRQFRTLASKAHASQRTVMKIVYETTDRVRESWKKLRTELPLTDSVRNSIEAHMQNMKLFIDTDNRLR